MFIISFPPLPSPITSRTAHHITPPNPCPPFIFIYLIY